MAVHVNISDRPFLMGGVNVWIWTGEHQSEARLLRVAGDTYSWESIPDAVQADPTLALDEGSARALTEALVRHFSGAEDTRSLRRDYDAERARVDRLTEALIEITTRPHSP